jgi:hypothetical protein
VTSPSTLPTASRLEADGLAQRIERAAAMLRDAASRLDSYAEHLRQPPSDSSGRPGYVPHSAVAHNALNDVIMALANLSLPGIMMSAATADVYLTRETAGQE